MSDIDELLTEILADLRTIKDRLENSHVHAEVNFSNFAICYLMAAGMIGWILFYIFLGVLLT